MAEMMDLTDDDGLDVHKFHVARMDGTSGPHGKHEFCRYFVLDLAHDPYAVPAIRAYVQACRETHPLLAADLATLATRLSA